MKRSKNKCRFFLNIIIFAMIFTGLFALQGCKGLSLVSGKSPDAQSSASAGQPDNSSAQDENSAASQDDSDNGESGSRRRLTIPAAAAKHRTAQADDSQNASGAQDANKEPVFITYIGEDNSFAFQYPANILTLSSNVFVCCRHRKFKALSNETAPG